MTGIPPQQQPTDWNALYGPGSQMYRDELSAFNSSRDSFLNGMMQVRGQMTQGMQYPGQQYTQPAQTPPMQQGGQLLQKQQDPQAWQDEDLVAAAVYWGIPEDVARKMPRAQVVSIVQQARTAVRKDEGSFATAGNVLLGIPAMMAVGAGEAITGGLSRLPIIGEALGRLKIVHDSDMKLREMEESIRSVTPDSMQWLNTASNLTGNVAALWFPGTAAWSLAGKIGSVVPWIGMLGATAGPIARLASQGAISGLALAGRPVVEAYMKTMTGQAQSITDQEAMEALTTLGASAALPVAWEVLSPVATALATRVQKAFAGPELLQAHDYRPGVMGPRRARGPEGAETVTTPSERVMQLRGMASTGDQQAQMMLDYMGGSSTPMEVGPSSLPWQTGAQSVWEGATDLGRGQFLGLPGTPMPKVSWADLSPEMQESVGLISGYIGQEVDRAGSLAAQMNKAATIVQSPDFPAIAGSASIDESSAARAAFSTNPGGENITQGISNPALFAAGTDQNVRFAQRGTRLDAITSDMPITDSMVGEYERFGMYTGQKVYTPEGLSATISKLEGLDAWVHIDYNHTVPWKVGQSDLHPWVSTPQPREVPQMWDAFNSYADQRVVATAEAMGGAMRPEQLESVRSTNLQQYMQDFFGEMKIDNPSDQGRIRKYFNLRFMDAIKQTEPEAAAIQHVYENLASEVARNAPPAPAVQSLDQAAAAKGFIAVPDQNGGWTMQEAQGITSPGSQPVRVSFGSQEAAKEWVTKVNRELKDITPDSDVPLDLVSHHLRSPTQGPNLNAQTHDSLLSSLADMEAGGLDGASNLPPASAAAGSGNIGRLKNQWTEGFLKWKPARRLFSQLDEALTQARVESGQYDVNPGFSADYDYVSNALVKHHNDQHPWMDRATDILAPVDTKRLVDGSFTRIYEIEDDVARLAAAKAAGFSNKEFQALDDVHQFFRDMFQETGLDPNREIKQYISHIAQRQSTPELMGKAFEDFPLTGTTKPFYEYQRTGNLNARELDTRELMDAYIRSVTWQKNMAEPFNAIASKWKGLAEDEMLAPASTIMENWLKIIRYGYHANDDLALDTMHGAMRIFLGPDVTRQQARELFNFGLNATHSGLLGFRFNVMARDAQQFWLAMPRAGKDMLSTIAKFTTSGAERDRIWQEAIDAGAVNLQMPRMVAPGAMEGALEQAAYAPAPSEQGWRMRAVGKVSSAVRDLMPDRLKDIRDTPLHPMYLYGKQSEMMKAIVYQAGKEKAANALADFRMAGPAGDWDVLMGQSSARTFDPAWQRQFQQLVASGDDAGAASFLGRQLADATQFKYGVTESPWVAKSITGRIALQFGNYSMQYYQYVMEIARNGTRSDKIKHMMVAGAVTAGIEAASQATGWNFRYMNPFFGLGFTVGPWIGLMSSIAGGISSAVQQAYGNDPTQGTTARMSEATASLGRAGSMLNPLGGLWEATQAAGQIANSPYPGLAAARYLITGDQSQSPDINLQMIDDSRRALVASMQPMSSPTRANAYGTTQIPPSLPVYPQTMVDSGGGVGRGEPSAIDTTSIPFTQYPQAGSSSVYDVNTTLSALTGNPDARRFFAPDEVAFMDSLRGVPSTVALEAFRSFMRQKVQGERPPQGGAGAGGYNSPPGAGAMF